MSWVAKSLTELITTNWSTNQYSMKVMWVNQIRTANSSLKWNHNMLHKKFSEWLSHFRFTWKAWIHVHNNTLCHIFIILALRWLAKSSTLAAVDCYAATFDPRENWLDCTPWDGKADWCNWAWKHTTSKWCSHWKCMHNRNHSLACEANCFIVGFQVIGNWKCCFTNNISCWLPTFTDTNLSTNFTWWYLC